MLPSRPAARPMISPGHWRTSTGVRPPGRHSKQKPRRGIRRAHGHEQRSILGNRQPRMNEGGATHRSRQGDGGGHRVGAVRRQPSNVHSTERPAVRAHPEWGRRHIQRASVAAGNQVGSSIEGLRGGNRRDDPVPCHPDDRRSFVPLNSSGRARDVRSFRSRSVDSSELFVHEQHAAVRGDRYAAQPCEPDIAHGSADLERPVAAAPDVFSVDPMEAALRCSPLPRNSVRVPGSYR